jgi:hypothetical protein
MPLFGSSSSSSKTANNAKQDQFGKLNLQAANKGKVKVDGLTFENMDAQVARTAILGAADQAKTVANATGTVARDGLALAGEVSEDSQKTARQLGTDAFGTAAAMQDRALTHGENLAGDAFDVAGDTVADARETSRQALTTAARGTERALSFAANSTRSDASQALEEVAKWGGIAALGLGLAFALKG